MWQVPGQTGLEPAVSPGFEARPCPLPGCRGLSGGALVLLQANHQRQRQRQQLQRLKFQIQVIVSTSLAPVPISFCPGLPARVQGLWRRSPQVRAFLLPQAALVTAGGRQSVLWSSMAGLPPGRREGAGGCSRSGSLAQGLQACGGQCDREAGAEASCLCVYGGWSCRPAVPEAAGTASF